MTEEVLGGQTHPIAKGASTHYNKGAKAGQVEHQQLAVLPDAGLGQPALLLRVLDFEVGRY